MREHGAVQFPNKSLSNPDSGGGESTELSLFPNKSLSNPDSGGGGRARSCPFSQQKPEIRAGYALTSP